ncbi:Glutaredoxin [Merluccius polli]|uniref:Glutaredoxin n=1 Tax=Merluccius polli TaxID=89951 RepID=A0AA47N8Y7_MERPO|nr:Glutaredoxin [Merluccius polli]
MCRPADRLSNPVEWADSKGLDPGSHYIGETMALLCIQGFVTVGRHDDPLHGEVLENDISVHFPPFQELRRIAAVSNDRLHRFCNKRRDRLGYTTGVDMGESDSSAQGRVTIYSIQGCPHCVQAKASLGRLGVPVCEVDLGQHPELRAAVKELTGRSTVPQIFFNQVHVGGNDDLQKLDPEKLQKLVHLVRDEPTDEPPLPADDQSEGGTWEADGEFKCEKDELASLVEDFKLSKVIGSHRMGLSLIRKSFSERQLIDWLQKERSMARALACETGLALLERKYMLSVGGSDKHAEGSFGEGSRGDTLYRLLEHESPLALNTGQTAACSPLQAAKLSAMMREIVLKLFSDHLSADGKRVDYQAMAKSPLFERYCDMAVQLQRVELLSLSREEKLAFFINTYNALVIHGYLRLGPPTNMWQRYRFFNYVSYLIGGEVFTLQDIENGVLRGNRKGMAQFLRPFSKSDPRLQMALPDAEPLIHFALNCGAKGCPPIKTYTPQDIDSQLRTAAEAFLENDDGCAVDCRKQEVRLSQIFKWYKADFGGTDEKVLNWVLEHMSDSPKRSNLEIILSAGKTKLSYLPYDWSTNSTN